jgi:hypothetical protein
MKNNVTSTYDGPMPKVLQLYLAISQYPVLSHTIRDQMRRELFMRGIISEEAFNREVLQKAVESQKREGLTEPLHQESPQDWDKRVRYIRAHLTDFYFAYNLPHTLFEQILNNVLRERMPDHAVQLTFNPEIAPWDMLFTEGERFLKMPPDEQAKVQHHLREIVVVLIKTMISDHLTFVRLAKEVFTLDDLKDIRDRRLGRGKIGGKAAGMLLAWRLLQQAGKTAGLDPSLLMIPESWYVGSDVFYEVHEYNDFHAIMNQKYKPREDIIRDYPMIYERYEHAELPPGVEDQLRDLMERIGQVPLIFRSSSLLEDNFSTAFAGKYDSFFLPNQGTPEQNFEEAKRAIMRIYASTLSPDALIYRQRMGLVDFDERMAILIQKVSGQRYNNLYYPMIAGVGYSRNPFRWNHQIRREDGLLRLVCGLGTRAVERADNDYPRMVALSHPQLRPISRVEQMRQYSQHLIDVLDLEDNTFKTLPIRQVINGDFPALRLVASQDTGQFVQPFLTKPSQVDPAELVFNFDLLAADANFTGTMRTMLAYLEERYEVPVDIEFAVNVTKTYPRPQFHICLLQCRPLTARESKQTRRVPANIAPADKLFSANRQIPEGIIERVRYIVFVQPEAYHSLKTPQRRLEVGRLVGRINAQLKDEQFVIMGPGRWGTSDIQLGVKVSYADIFNTRALIEVAYSTNGGTPEMAYGTHFFQDLVEAGIHPLALFPDDPGVCFNWDFFRRSPNVLPALLPDDQKWADVVTVIDVPAVTNGRLAEIIMNADHDEALGYLRHY